MEIKAVLFDLDGTLIDSAPVIATVLNGVRREIGQMPHSVECYRKWVSLGANQLIANALEIPPTEIATYLEEFRSRYRALPTPAEALYPTVFQTISKLAREGIQLAICSNKPKVLCEKILHETGLTPFFSCVIGGDTTLNPKPNREPIDLALATLGVSHQQALFVGDSSIDQGAALAAGLPFIFFKGGYDDGVHQDSAWASIERIDQLLVLTGGLLLNQSIQQ